MSEKIVIDEGLCQEIEKLHYSYKALEQVVTSYLDQHALDVDDSAVSNPVFVTFQKRLTEAFMEYESKKLEMVKQYGIADSGWSLDFAYHEVTVL